MNIWSKLPWRLRIELLYQWARIEESELLTDIRWYKDGRPAAGTWLKAIRMWYRNRKDGDYDAH